jgi:hypothetical protein
MKWRGVEVIGVSGGKMAPCERGSIERQSKRILEGEVGGKRIREGVVQNPKELPR